MPPDVTDPLEEHRTYVASLVRRFRKSAGFNGTELAEQLGWSQSRISRLETGRQSPSEYEAREIAKVLGLSRKDLSELIDAVRNLDMEFVATRHVAAKGAQQRQDEIRSIEASSQTIRSFTLSAIPGLLQTPDYTRALCRVDFDTQAWTDEQIEGAVELRKERQEILNDESKTFSFLIADTALWFRYGSNAAMRQQLDYLITCVSSKRFRLGIIPRTASLSVMPLCGFKIHDDRLVQIDALTGEFNLTDPEDIRLYDQAFDILSSSAVTGKSAKKLIEDGMSELF